MEKLEIMNEKEAIKLIRSLKRLKLSESDMKDLKHIRETKDCMLRLRSLTETELNNFVKSMKWFVQPESVKNFVKGLDKEKKKRYLEMREENNKLNRKEWLLYLCCISENKPNFEFCEKKFI
jgi:hypothetical protein